MATALRLTITEVAGSINRQFGQRVPIWKLRRVIDDLEARGTLDVQRIANYRTVSDDDIVTITDELCRLGWLGPASTREAVASCQ